ncbi:MAG: DUF6476 family protein [Pseudomonadota bacterium]
MADDPQEDPNLSPGDAANLRFLRRLVTILTATMILGVIIIITLLVIRLTDAPRSIPAPAQLALPEGTRVIAITQTAENILVVTEAQNLLIFDASGTELIRAIQLAPPGEGS